MTIFVTAFSGLPTHDILPILNFIAVNGTPTVANSTELTIVANNGGLTQSVTIRGVGLTYDLGTGEFIGGTVTDLEIYENGGLLQDFNLSRPATQVQTLIDDIEAGVPNAFSTFVGVENGNFNGSALGDVFNFGDGNDLIFGNGGDDVLLGLGGNDNIFGGAGNDWIEPGTNNGFDGVGGSTGNDTIVYSGAPLFQSINYRNVGLSNGITANIDAQGGNASVDKGADGTDTILNIVNTQMISAGLGDGFGISGTEFDDVFNITSDPDGYIQARGYEGNDTFNISSGYFRLDYRQVNNGVVVNLASGTVTNDGFGFVDTINGSVTEVHGTTFIDSLTGSAADERFITDQGNDTVDGGAGIDLIRYDRNGVVSVTVDLMAGTASGMWSGQAFTDTLSNIENIRGSLTGADVLLGNASDNWIDGKGGDDTLEGRGGDDLLIGDAGGDMIDGGAGSDQAGYSVSDAGVTVFLDSGVGSFASGGHATGDTLISIENLSGSAFGDVLIGNNDANRLEGKDGNDELGSGSGDDSLFGGDGTDVLVGGAGADALDGGAGFDVALYLGSSSGVTINLAAGTGFGGEAQGDTFVDVETVIGSLFDDTLIGNGSANFLVGRDGDDVFEGLEGGDIIVGGDGIDRASYSGSNDTVAINLVNLSGIGGHAAGDQLVGIENVTGSAFGDLLVGDAADNVFNGLAGGDLMLGGGGNDTLAGGSGGDIMTGGAGDDSFVFDVADVGSNNIVIDFDQDGNDRLVFSGFGPGFDFTDFTLDIVNGNDVQVQSVSWNGSVYLQNAGGLVDAGDFVFV